MSPELARSCCPRRLPAPGALGKGGRRAGAQHGDRRQPPALGASTGRCCASSHTLKVLGWRRRAAGSGVRRLRRHRDRALRGAHVAPRLPHLLRARLPQRPRPAGAAPFPRGRAGQGEAGPGRPAPHAPPAISCCRRWGAAVAEKMASRSLRLLLLGYLGVLSCKWPRPFPAGRAWALTGYRYSRERPGASGDGPLELRACVSRREGLAPVPASARARPCRAPPRAAPAARCPLRGASGQGQGQGAASRGAVAELSPPERGEPSCLFPSEIQANGVGVCALIISMCLLFWHRCNLFNPGLCRRKGRGFLQPYKL